MLFPASTRRHGGAVSTTSATTAAAPAAHVTTQPGRSSPEAQHSLHAEECRGQKRENGTASARVSLCLGIPEPSGDTERLGDLALSHAKKRQDDRKLSGLTERAGLREVRHHLTLQETR